MPGLSAPVTTGRTVLRTVAAILGSVPASTAPVHAQGYPSKPTMVVVGLAAGSAQDATTRLSASAPNSAGVAVAAVML
jgi:tripartite-type tricarboxylate transporter receptor subunit TctC